MLLAACGKDPAPATPAENAWPLDGFLQYLPDNLSLTLRLPSADAPPAGIAKLLEALGRAGLFQAPGLDSARSQGLAVTTAGAWVHYLPAKDKAQLNRALQAGAHKVAHREESDWTILSLGGKGAGRVQGEPLPPGHAALRVRFHPLLDLVFPPGDTLEAGLTLGGAGFDLSGRLRPGEGSPTAARVAGAAACQGGWIDLIPASLAVRAETTLPAPALAAMLTRTFGAYCGIPLDKDRVLVERFLRELLTGLDQTAGIAIGIEFKEGQTSFVAIGRIGEGPPSPLLAGVRSHARSSFGPLVLDARREAPKGIIGHYAWLTEPKPVLKGLPESLWGLVGDLTGGEDGGLPTAYVAPSRWFVFGAGRRADRLVASVYKRLRGGAQSSAGSRALRAARERGKGDYVLGLVLSGSGFDGLAANDRKQIARLLHAGENAQMPDTIALSLFRDGEEIRLEGRALY